MRVVILHNAVSANAATDEQDVLVQLKAVTESLQRLGHDPTTIPCTLNLEFARQQLLESRPDLIVNLVESLGGSDWLMFLPTALVDSLNLPYTGSPTEAIFQTTHKVLAKQRLSDAGLATPAWIDVHTGDLSIRSMPFEDADWDGNDLRWIAKAVWEHASIGMDDDSVFVVEDLAGVERRLRDRQRATGKRHFAERFIAGREFNISLLANGNDVEVLPAAEIDFSQFPTDKPAIVGYQAKWDEASAEYQQTPRRFEFAHTDRSLLESLEQLSLECWHLFGMRGYARVDFRVDEQETPWILEVNANPCLSPDAGFAAALERAGITFDNAVERIIYAALRES